MLKFKVEKSRVRYEKAGPLNINAKCEKEIGLLNVASSLRKCENNSWVYV